MAEFVLLLDADMLAHRAMVNHESEYEIDPGVWTRYASVNMALQEYWRHVDNWMTEFRVTDRRQVIHCFTHWKTFRYMLYPGYKKHRKPKPIGYGAMKDEIFKTTPSAMCLPFLEADDLIGIYADLARKVKKEPIIISGDKDLRQVPGYHAQWFTTEPFTISEHEAKYYFYKQTLTGDSTDGIPGCPGFGEVSAEKVLAACWPVGPWEEIVSAFAKGGRSLAGKDPEGEAVLQARLIRILRDGDYDFESQSVNLWLPPQVTSTLTS